MRMDHSGPGVKTSASHPASRGGSAIHPDVALAAAGDRHAFERVYREHVGRVFGLARRMIGPEEAGEVTQDVFVRAWERLGSFRGEAAFSTWLHRVAVNVILTRRARLGTARSRFLDAEDALERLPAPARSGDLGLDFEGAIARLPEGARQIFVLHDIEGYRHDEIADRLGVTTGTTKAQLHRARMLLRRHLKPQDT